MIIVFNALPLQLGSGPATFSPFNSRASSVATEITNTIEWLIEA